jgi:hypothetical protein
MLNFSSIHAFVCISVFRIYPKTLDLICDEKSKMKKNDVCDKKNVTRATKKFNILSERTHT